jgi:cytochrome c
MLQSVAFIGGLLIAGLLAVAPVAVADELNAPDIKTELAADPAPNVAAGGEVFRRQCLACHTAEPSQHKTGPSLAGVVGRKAGSTDFPRYRGLTGADFDWTNDRLNAYLADPRTFVLANTNNATTSMSFRVPDAAQRRDVIGYLQTLK